MKKPRATERKEMRGEESEMKEKEWSRGGKIWKPVAVVMTFELPVMYNLFSEHTKGENGMSYSEFIKT